MFSVKIQRVIDVRSVFRQLRIHIDEMRIEMIKKN